MRIKTRLRSLRPNTPAEGASADFLRRCDKGRLFSPPTFSRRLWTVSSCPLSRLSIPFVRTFFTDDAQLLTWRDFSGGRR